MSAAQKGCVEGRAASGTVAALVKLYYASPEWLTLALQSQRTYRNILESFVAEHGDKSVRALEREHVKAMVNAKAATPAAANKFRKLLSVLMRVAIDTGWRDDNPVTTVKGIRTKSDGFRTWTDEEIAAFERGIKWVRNLASHWSCCFAPVNVGATLCLWDTSISRMVCLRSDSRRHE
jgi:hypothetical protein